MKAYRAYIGKLRLPPFYPPLLSASFLSSAHPPSLFLSLSLNKHVFLTREIERAVVQLMSLCAQSCLLPRCKTSLYKRARVRARGYNTRTTTMLRRAGRKISHVIKRRHEGGAEKEGMTREREMYRGEEREVRSCAARIKTTRASFTERKNGFMTVMIICFYIE